MAEVLRLEEVNYPCSEEEERELYERAHQAAKEAQRQGDAQLKAAVAAASSILLDPAPLDSSTWSLSFPNRRLEAVYWRKKCGTQPLLTDFFPIALELLLQLWTVKATSVSRSALLKFGHTSVAACCLSMMLLQLWVSNWYRHNRGLLLCYFVIVLWCWECLQLYHGSSNSLFRMVFQSLVLSYVYRVPFCLHMRVRSLGLCAEAVATIARDASRSAVLQLLAILLSHLAGSALAYLLERRSRWSFLVSLPAWLVTDAPSKQQQNCCPDFLEKPTNHNTHRALGGFAGGFGGVSGLKCSTGPACIPTVVSSSSTLDGDSQQQLLLSQESSSSASLSLEQDSISSASSQVQCSAT